MTDFGKCSGECADVLRQLWEFLDEELTADRMVAVRAHLDRCAGCYPEYDFERIFLEAVAATGRQRCASVQLRERILEQLRQAGFTGRMTAARTSAS
jgi:anti-sigma factor (TIGR02949 family)